MNVFLRMHSRPQIIFLQAVACPLAAAFILISSACVIVPVRLPTQTKDISGKVQKLDFTFLKAGSTTRDEVNKNLAPINTQANEPEFFWGRWDSLCSPFIRHTDDWSFSGIGTSTHRQG